MKQVICTGLAVLDHVFYLPKIPKKPIKSFATNYQTVGGGNAATAAVAIRLSAWLTALLRPSPARRTRPSTAVTTAAQRPPAVPAPPTTATAT